jgi:hypothetical protein
MMTNRLTEKEAIAKGLCGACRKQPLAPGRKARCAECLEKTRLQKKARALRGAAG